MIMSDIWIERQCKETHVLVKEIEDKYCGVSAYRKQTAVNELEDERRNWAGLMIEPFVNTSVKTRLKNEGTTDEIEERIISYGLSSYGYDARLADEFKLFTNINNSVVDPLNFDDRCYVDMKADSILIPPNSFVLGRTIEHFRIPRDILVICLGKSTIARAGAIVNVTPLEPEWCGYVTIEISNTTPLPLRIHAGMGICQFLFLKGEQPCRVSYADRGGKYQNQKANVVPPKV